MMTTDSSQDVLRGRRVLVVEDQYLIADEMRRTVERLGGQVLGPVSTLDGALSLAVRGGLDLALLDVDLHGSEIYPAADELMSIAPVIFTTGFERDAMPPGYRDLPRLDKPVTARALAAAWSDLSQSPS
jgi:CheY-like chemotaxis protein